jgi:hypothetical protein
MKGLQGLLKCGRSHTKPLVAVVVVPRRDLLVVSLVLLGSKCPSSQQEHGQAKDTNHVAIHGAVL